MEKINVKKCRKTKPVHYRQRHKKLEHIGESVTKHGFKERLKVAEIQSHASNSAYFSVLEFGQTHSTIEVDNENYRFAATALDDNLRVRQPTRRNTPATPPNTHRSPEIESSWIGGQECTVFSESSSAHRRPRDNLQGIQQFSYIGPIWDEGPQYLHQSAATTSGDNGDFTHLGTLRNVEPDEHPIYSDGKQATYQYYSPYVHQEIVGKEDRMQSQYTGDRESFSCLPAVLQTPVMEPEDVIMEQRIAPGITSGGNPDPAFWTESSSADNGFAIDLLDCKANDVQPLESFLCTMVPQGQARDISTLDYRLLTSRGTYQNPYGF